MMIEQTLQQLTSMKINGIAETLGLRLEEATAGNWGYAELLSILVQDEKTYRENAKTKRLLRGAKFRVDAHLESFDYRAKRSVTKAQIKELANLSFLKTSRNLLLLGPTGVGKTYLASALGNQACRLGHTTRFVSMSTFIEQLSLARAEGNYLRFRDRIAKIELLILDDLGIKALDNTATQDLYDILEERYHKYSTIITSQLPLENWKEVIPDEVAFDAIMDRLAHSSIKVEITGDSYRKTQGKVDKK